jgi:hypothetical protein
MQDQSSINFAVTTITISFPLFSESRFLAKPPNNGIFPIIGILVLASLSSLPSLTVGNYVGLPVKKDHQNEIWPSAKGCFAAHSSGLN